MSESTNVIPFSYADGEQISIRDVRRHLHDALSGVEIPRQKNIQSGIEEYVVPRVTAILQKRGWSSRSIRIVTDDTGQIGSLIEVVPTTRQGVVTTKVAPGFKQAVKNMATPAGSG